MDFINYWQELPKAAILAGTVNVPANKNLLRDAFTATCYFCGGNSFVVVLEDGKSRLQGLARTDTKSFIEFYKGL